MHRAGGIHQTPTGAQQRRDRREQTALHQHEFVDHRRCDPPAGIGMARQRAQAGTGGIQQDGVEGADPVWMQGGQLAGIGSEKINALQLPQPLGVGPHPAQAGLGAIHRPELSVAPQGFGDLGGLATRCGAGIEDPLPGPGGQQGHHGLGMAILHAPAPLPEAGQGAEIAGAARQREGQGVIRQGLGHHPCRGEGRLLAGPVGAKGIDPQVEGGRRGRGPGEGLGPLGRQPGEQGCGQPGGQRVAEPQALGGIGGEAEAIPGGQGAGEGVAAAHHRPEDGVHRGGQPGQPDAAREGHAGAHGRRHRHPLAEEDLVQTHMEEPAQGWGLALGHDLGMGVDPGIQQAPLTNGAVGQLGDQPPIQGRERSLGQLPLQRRIGIGSGRHRLEHTPDAMAGFEARGIGNQPRGLRHQSRGGRGGCQRKRARGSRPWASTGIPSASSRSRWIQSLPSRLGVMAMQPRAFTTRCQGMAEGSGRRRRAQPTWRARPQAPSSSATWP